MKVTTVLVMEFNQIFFGNKDSKLQITIILIYTDLIHMYRL